MSDKYVVLGAGIIGLYTALELADQDKAHATTVVAEFLPGDQSINYTSPWAGANFSCAAGSDPKALEHDKQTFQRLDSFYKRFGTRVGLAKLPVCEYFATGDEITKEKIQSMGSYIPDFRVIAADNDTDKELPEGINLALKYTTFNFNAPGVIKFLQEYLTSHGVTFLRRRLDHVNDAFLSKSTKYVFNCTGIGARHLPGVEDDKVYPARGQVVVIKAPHVQENVMMVAPHYVTYTIPRPGTGGHVVLGGYKDDDDWRGDTFGYQTANILERNLQMFPKIGEKPIEVVKEAAGLRPGRVGGVRIERENVDNGRAIIHNYGALGAGYQSGIGMAIDAVALLKNESKL